jgi:hypothetical protein
MHWLAADVVGAVAAVVADVVAAECEPVVARAVAAACRAVAAVDTVVVALAAHLPCRDQPVGHRRSIGQAAAMQAGVRVTVICQLRAGRELAVVPPPATVPALATSPVGRAAAQDPEWALALVQVHDRVPGRAQAVCPPIATCKTSSTCPVAVMLAQVGHPVGHRLVRAQAPQSQAVRWQEVRRPNSCRIVPARNRVPARAQARAISHPICQRVPAEELI